MLHLEMIYNRLLKDVSKLCSWHIIRMNKDNMEIVNMVTTDTHSVLWSISNDVIADFEGFFVDLFPVFPFIKFSI